MKTFQQMSYRMYNVILISPCLTRGAMQLSQYHIRLGLAVSQFLGQKRVRAGFLRLLHSPRTVGLMFRFLQRISRLESTIELRLKLLTLSESTLEVLDSQIGEILTVQLPEPTVRHTTPCYLWMSVNDPVLDFETTLATAQAHFMKVNVVRSEITYHQPPEPFTYESLNREYYETVNGFLNKSGSA